MVWHPTKEACRRLWGRRWTRRITYLIAAGVGVSFGGSWLLQRPAVARWAVSKADAWLRDETGLSLSVGHAEVHPLFGSLSLDDVALGGDLLTIRHVELRLDLGSLFVGTPHIYTARIVEPHARLSPDRVARIRLKPHPKKDEKTPEVLLDLLSVSGAKIDVLEPVWGLPECELGFDLKGRGLGPNQVHVNLVAPLLRVRGPHGNESGHADLDADLSDRWMVVKAFKGELGRSRLAATGAFQPRAEQRFELKADASADLAQVSGWLSQRAPAFSGRLDTKLEATGTVAQPRWTFTAKGADLKPGDTRFAPGRLELQAKGSLKEAAVERLHWESSQGRLDANGHWTPSRTAAHVEAHGLSLEPVAQAGHAAPLSGATADLTADLQGPGEPQAMASPQRWQATLKATLAQNGQPAGGFNATLKDGLATVPSISLRLEALQVDGSGGGRIDARGLASFQAKGNASVDAGVVADTLRGWKVVDLDMGGAADAAAEVAWTRSAGLTLDGSVDASQPRWHHAQVDHLKAGVAIRGDQLAVKDIHLEKDKGTADGEIQLTWARRHPGDDFDLRMAFKDMPLAEGLRAADLDLPMTGLGTGDARLHGPYDHLMLLGRAQLADGRIYGVAVPAAATDYDFDLKTLLLRLQDLRIADAVDHLGAKEGGKPSGDLALKGGGSLDLAKLTADLRLAGALDTGVLQLPIPQIQGAADLHLDGPLASPFGGLSLPEGTLKLRDSIVFFQDQSLVGLEADISRKGPKLATALGFANRPQRALTLDLGDRGATLFGSAALRLDDKTAPTQALASQFSHGVLQDLRLDLDANGTFSGGGLRWQGRLAELSGDFGAFDLAQSRPTELRGTEKAATLSLELEGRQKGETGAPSGRATLAGTLPFSTHEGMDLRSAGAMDLANFKVILDTLLDVDPYSALGETKPKGRAEYDLRAYGTYDAPYADGQLRLTEGSLRLGDYPSLDHLTFTLLAKGRDLVLPKDNPLRATLAQGALTVDGTATWALGGLTSYNFNASLGGFQLRDLPGLEGAEAAGNLAVTLRGDEDGGVLRGRVDADRLSYQADINLSDLILKSALSESGLSLLNPDDPLDRIALDLDLNLAQPWNCDTNLLKLEGRPEGAFKVLGTLAHPGLKGRMDFLPGGRVTNLLPAGDVVIDRGYLSFTDPASNDPYINLHGTVQVPGYQVELDVHGTLSNLDIVPSSTPSLRRDEIVAILIQPELASTIASSTPGSSQSALSSGLASASSGLITTLALADLQERVRRTFGLDRVSVSLRTGGGSGNLERDIQVGKTFTFFDRRIPLLAFQRKSGELTTTGATIELRFGGVVLNLGVAQSAGQGLDPTGEVTHTWSPR